VPVHSGQVVKQQFYRTRQTQLIRITQYGTCRCPSCPIRQTRQDDPVCVVSGESSFETVWQSLNSQPIDHPRRVSFSEEVEV